MRSLDGRRHPPRAGGEKPRRSRPPSIPDGTQTYVNRAFCALVGFEEDELLGRAGSVPLLAAGRDREHPARVRAHDGRSSAGGGLVPAVRQGRAPIRRARVHRAVAVGRAVPQGGMATVVDVTERVESERRLRRSESLLAGKRSASGSWGAGNGIGQRRALVVGRDVSGVRARPGVRPARLRCATSSASSRRTAGGCATRYPARWRSAARSRKR